MIRKSVAFTEGIPQQSDPLTHLGSTTLVNLNNTASKWQCLPLSYIYDNNNSWTKNLCFHNTNGSRISQLSTLRQIAFENTQFFKCWAVHGFFWWGMWVGRGVGSDKFWSCKMIFPTNLKRYYEKTKWKPFC